MSKKVSTWELSVFFYRPDALPDRQHQSTEWLIIHAYFTFISFSFGSAFGLSVRRLLCSYKPSSKHSRSSIATTRRSWKISEGFSRNRWPASSSGRCRPWRVHSRSLVVQERRRNRRLLAVLYGVNRDHVPLYSIQFLFVFCSFLMANAYFAQFLLSQYFILLFSWDNSR